MTRRSSHGASGSPSQRSATRRSALGHRDTACTIWSMSRRARSRPGVRTPTAGGASRRPRRGEAPCFVAVDPEGELLAVANYGSGSVVLFKLDPETGVILPPRRIYRHHGQGPDLDRQDGPHAHCARFHGGFLYATDLGADTVMALDYRAVESEPFVALTVPAGQGPRHILFHPRRPCAYLLTELGSRIFLLDRAEDGRLVERQSLSTLPIGFTGDSLGGHLAMSCDGSRLYVSNRGHDSLGLFDIGEDGLLSLRQIAPTHGASPRHFRLVEGRGRILVAHEEGGGVCVLEMAVDGGVGGLLQALPLAKAAFIGATSD